MNTNIVTYIVKLLHFFTHCNVKQTCMSVNASLTKHIDILIKLAIHFVSWVFE